jgi:hypothetical protein
MRDTATLLILEDELSKRLLVPDKVVMPPASKEPRT